MATRLQQLNRAFSTIPQSNISTPAPVGTPADWIRMLAVGGNLTSPNYVLENDANMIGKPNEFPTQTFASHIAVKNAFDLYASSEWATWCLAYGLGGVSVVGSSAPYTYTINPINSALGLQLPYFSMAEVLLEGSASTTAVDNLFAGCAIDEWVYSFNYGVGRQSSRLTASMVGSGIITTPSGFLTGSTLSMPATAAVHNMLAGSMTSLIINSIDYVATGRIVSGTISWKNNFLPTSYYPGSGVSNGYQIAGRFEIGPRVCGFSFKVRAVAGSSEYTSLISQTSGTVTVAVSADTGDSLSFVFEKVLFQAVELGEVDGLVVFEVTALPAQDTTANFLTVTTKTGIPAIG